MNEHRIGFTMIIILWIYCMHQVHYFLFPGNYNMSSFFSGRKEQRSKSCFLLFDQTVKNHTGGLQYSRDWDTIGILHWFNRELPKTCYPKNGWTYEISLAGYFVTTQNTVIIMVINNNHDDYKFLFNLGFFFGTSQALSTWLF